jgi:hypothetical protein
MAWSRPTPVQYRWSIHPGSHLQAREQVSQNLVHPGRKRHRAAWPAATYDRYHLLVAAPWPAFAQTAFVFVIALNFIFALLYTLRPDAVQYLLPATCGKSALRDIQDRTDTFLLAIVMAIHTSEKSYPL